MGGNNKSALKDPSCALHAENSASQGMQEVFIYYCRCLSITTDTEEPAEGRGKEVSSV